MDITGNITQREIKKLENAFNDRETKIPIAKSASTLTLVKDKKIPNKK